MNDFQTRSEMTHGPAEGGAAAVAPARARPRSRSLRVALGWLFGAVLLPLLVAGAGFLVYQWKQQRELAVTHLQDHARTLQRAVDRELSLDLAVLRALAASREIDRGDWRAFDALAAEAAAVRPGSWFVLYERSGQMVVNSSVPFGSGPLPNFRALRAGGPDVEWEGRNIPKAGANFAAPFETASPSFTGLMYAPILRRPAVVTVVPVFRERQPVYALSLVYSSRFFDELLRAERDPGVTTALLDQRGVFIARNPDSEKFVGRVGPAPFDHGAAQLPRAGVGEGLNAESIPVVYAFSRSEVTDYVVAAGMPRSAVLAPAWRALWLSLSVLLSAGALGTVFAIRLWRRVGTPLTALAEQARSLGESHGEIAATGIDEVDALRTPLATLSLHTQGLSRMLSGGSLDEARVRRKLARMDDQLARLDRLVGTLLDVSRITAGRLHLDRGPCDLARVAADAVEHFEDVSERSGTRFTLRASPAVGAWDRLRIEQVLTNLLDNATKYAPGSDVGVTAEARDREAVLRVRDSGPGISVESQVRIFDQYERAAEAHVFGGLGLGLWISRQIVEAHGGTISVESAPGAGSTFTVRLPREAP